MSAAQTNRSRRWRLLGDLGLLGMSLLGMNVSKAQAGSPLEPSPWHRLRSAAPTWAQSVWVERGDAPLRLRPDKSAKRRGSAGRQSLLPLFGIQTGPGCQGAWFQVGAKAWLCAEHGRLSGNRAIAAGTSLLRPRADGMPFDYYFVSRDGSYAYSRIEKVDVSNPEMTLEPGFAVAIVEQRQLGSETYGRSNRGLWLPMRDLGLARPSAFHGETIQQTSSANIPFGWVVTSHATVYKKRGQLMSRTSLLRSRFQKVSWLEETRIGGRDYVRIDANAWLAKKQLRHHQRATPPKEVHVQANEKWIDIELSSQTLAAYEGATPVFVTLVSTGKGKRKGHPFETPKGTFRIWVKLTTSTMDNLENENASSFYRIEDVPYVQFFNKAVGLHAAFWHRSFGHVRSHGCVNLAPLDALRLFRWTGPRLGAGWTAALPTSFDRGTVIRVR